MLVLFFIVFIFFVFARFSAKEEVAFTWPYRNIEFGVMGDKSKLMRTYHRAGAVYVIMLSYGFAGMFEVVQVHSGRITAWWPAIGILIGVWLTCMATYWAVFDPYYAVGIGKPWHYLGDTADTDQWLRRKSKKAGRVKFWACVIFVSLALSSAWVIFGLV